jgi:hypothetical protein
MEAQILKNETYLSSDRFNHEDPHLSISQLNEQPLGADSNSVLVESAMVEGGHNNIIDGNSDYSEILGLESSNNVLIDAKNCSVVGNNNKVTGYGNRIRGSNNVVVGDNNIIFGNNQVVEGDNKYYITTENYM